MQCLCLLPLALSSLLLVRSIPIDSTTDNKPYKRDLDDADMMHRYWAEQLPLGFFVSNDDSTGDDDLTGRSDTPTVPDDIKAQNMLRDTISHFEGSGSEPKPENNKREKVPGSTIKEAAAASSNEESKLTTGSLKASVKEAIHEASATDPTSKVGDSPKADAKSAGAEGTPASKVEDAPKVENIEKAEEKTGSLKASVSEDEKAKDITDDEDPGDRRKKKSTTTCEGQKEWLQCDGPYELIKIKNAFWGRDNSHTCTRSGQVHGLKTDTNCAQDESNTINKVREACDNENVCEVVASPVYFDKTDCPDVYKFLRMDYECAPSESRIKESRDNN